MFDELQKAEARFNELETLLSDPDVIAQDSKYPSYLREHGSLARLVHLFQDYKKAKDELSDNEELSRDSSDPEMAELAASELPQLKKDLEDRLNALMDQILSKEDDGDRNCIVEFRAGTGGDESAIFVGDLVRMYLYYCEKNHWKTEVIDTSPSDKGGYKEFSVAINGEDVYAKLKYESGTHRVQRVPETESQGRVHTSAATVAVLPEAEEIDVQLKDEEVRKDLYCASGPGGQSVNTTYSAVRLTHLPTGIVAQCQDQKSQVKNTEKAMRVLRSRIYDHLKQIADSARSGQRKEQIGSGDRSQRIRTYNYPQNRITDHRINLTLYDLAGVIRGELDPVIQALREEDKRKRFGELYH